MLWPFRTLMAAGRAVRRLAASVLAAGKLGCVAAALARCGSAICLLFGDK